MKKLFVLELFVCVWCSLLDWFFFSLIEVIVYELWLVFYCYERGREFSEVFFDFVVFRAVIFESDNYED